MIVYCEDCHFYEYDYGPFYEEVCDEKCNIVIKRELAQEENYRHRRIFRNVYGVPSEKNKNNKCKDFKEKGFWRRLMYKLHY